MEAYVLVPLIILNYNSPKYSSPKPRDFRLPSVLSLKN